MVARFPESEAIMPRRTLTSRAYQLAADPESQVRMQRSGSLGDNSQKTRWGLIGFALFIARASSTFHQSDTPSSIFSRQARSVLRRSNGKRSWRVSLL